MSVDPIRWAADAAFSCSLCGFPLFPFEGNPFAQRPE